jgi:hypothetical protein
MAKLYAFATSADTTWLGSRLIAYDRRAAARREVQQHVVQGQSCFNAGVPSVHQHRPTQQGESSPAQGLTRMIIIYAALPTWTVA